MSAEDEIARSVINYAKDAEERYLACRAEGRHFPVRGTSGRYRDVRPDPAPSGGWIIQTSCQHCRQKLTRRLWPDFTPHGGWQIHYEPGYLAEPGQGTGLTSRRGRAMFRQFDLFGTFDELPADSGDAKRRPPRKAAKRKAAE